MSTSSRRSSGESKRLDSSQPIDKCCIVGQYFFLFGSVRSPGKESTQQGMSLPTLVNIMQKCKNMHRCYGFRHCL